MAEPTRAEITVDFPALIDLLSNFLYRDKSAVIRELLSNANDALIARAREGGFGEESPAIRLWLDHTAGRLVIADNGIGMGHDDLTDYLATIGASLTRRRSQEFVDDRHFVDSLIGRFGVGFLSAFIVAEKVVVETRKPDGRGYRWESERMTAREVQRGRGKGYTITECDLPCCGTTVFLDLKPAIQREWTDETIKRFVLENARHFEFPIYWGAEGDERLNSLQAPWYAEGPLEDKDLEAYRSFLANYGDHFGSAATASEIIPLHAEAIHGVLYIPPPSALQHEPVGKVDLYCKRVFVTRNHAEIIPEWFPYVRGIIDGYRFRLSASREDVQRDNHEYVRVREYIARQIMDHFANLARQAALPPGKDGEPDPRAYLARLRLQPLLDQFHLVLKHVLTLRADGGYKWEDRYLTALDPFLPFRSSSGEVTTLPEYLERRTKAGREREIQFVDSEAEYVTLRPIAEQKRLEFLWFKHEAEKEYVHRCSKITGIPCRPAAEGLPTQLPTLAAERGWQDILRFFEEQLDHPELSLSVHLSEFEPETVGGRLLVSAETEGRRRLEQLMGEMEQTKTVSRDDPLFRELERLKQKRRHVLYLNERHPVLRRLAQLIEKGVKVPLDLILHPLFHDVALAAGVIVPEGHLTDYQARAYEAALECALAQGQIDVVHNQFETERKKAAADLAAEKKRAAVAEQQAGELRQQLDHLTKQPARDGSSTDEVFFIRPMSDSFLDYASRRIAELCERQRFRLVDPTKVVKIGNILPQITECLRRSRFVIADISQTANANVYYEAGFVDGHFPNKLILIAEQSIIDRKELPFDFRTQRIVGYSKDAQGFDAFLRRLEETIQEVLAGLER